uniref:Uncharacterized protein n=1 Tax=Panagrolaimus superbus TaxID=310955 RepID=A0A914XU19_9BILA
MAQSPSQGTSELDTSWLDGIIEKLNSLYNRLDIGIVNIMTLDEIVAILTFVTKIINQEGSLVEVEVPIKFFSIYYGMDDLCY